MLKVDVISQSVLPDRPCVPLQVAATLEVIFENLTALVSVGLDKCNLGAQGAAAVAALAGLTSLVWLNLSDNNFGENMAALIASSLSQLTRLEALELGNNPLGEVGGRVVAAALERHRHLKSVGLEKSEISYRTLVSTRSMGVQVVLTRA